jgi:hypothetical protein
MFIYPIKGRRTQENILSLIEKFKKKVKTIKGLSGDDEFSSSKIVKYCDDNDIVLSSNIAAEDHINKGNFLGIVDAATRTIKSYIRNYKIANDTNVFINELPSLVSNYNNTPHSSLENKTPNEVWGDPEFKEQQLNDGIEHNKNLSEKINLRIGDYVRKKVDKKKFDKEGQKFSNEIYFIYDKIGNKFILQDENEIMQKRKYKYFELMKINKKKVEGKLSNVNLNKAKGKERAEMRLRRENLD